MSDPSSHAEHQKQRDTASYDPVAETFERLSDRFTQPLAEWMVESAAIRDDHHVLDVGTGTGVVALEAAGRLGPNGDVLGIDLSQGMLDRAAARAQTRGVADRVRFERGDAESLSLEDQSRDRVLSLYALLHFPDPAAAVREMWRVLRPGGRLVLAIGRAPERASLQGIAYLLQRLPLLIEQLRGKSLLAPALLDSLVGEMLPIESLRPGGEELALPAAPQHGHHVGPASLATLLSAEGFEGVRTHWEARLGVLDDVEEFWNLQATFSSFARDRIATAREVAPERVDAVRERFEQRSAQALQRGGRLLYPYAAYYATAARPTGELA